MSKRQFSFQKYWEDLSGGHVPLLSFSRADDYESWSRDARAKLLELLGPFPERCDLAAEVEYSVDEGDFIRERVVFDSEENMSVPCILLIPKSDQTTITQGRWPFTALSRCLLTSGASVKDATAMTGWAATPAT